MEVVVEKDEVRAPTGGDCAAIAGDSEKFGWRAARHQESGFGRDAQQADRIADRPSHVEVGPGQGPAWIDANAVARNDALALKHEFLGGRTDTRHRVRHQHDLVRGLAAQRQFQRDRADVMAVGNDPAPVIGPIADQVAGEIRTVSASGPGGAGADLATAIAETLGPFGIRTVDRCGSRLLITLDDPSGTSAAGLDRLGSRGWVAVAGGVQIIVGPEAEAVARDLRSKTG